MGKSMAVINSNGRSHQILENIFLTCGEIKCLGRHAQAITHPLLPFSSPILLHVGFLHATEASCVFILHIGSHFPHFCMPKNSFWYCLVSGQGRFTFFLHFHWFFNGWEPFSPCWVAKKLDSWFWGLWQLFWLPYFHSHLQISEMRFGFLQRSILALWCH